VSRASVARRGGACRCWATQRTMHRSIHFPGRAVPAGRRALTLIELLCLVAIAAVVLIAIYPKLSHGQPRLTATLTQMAVFKMQLSAFRDDNGFYPPGRNGLRDLIDRPPTATNWHGPYADGIPKDPWGQAYVYECPGKHIPSGYPYDLVSMGPLGASNPIANWANPGLPP